MHYQWWIVFRVNTVYTLNTIIGFISPIAIQTSLLNPKKVVDLSPSCRVLISNTGMTKKNTSGWNFYDRNVLRALQVDLVYVYNASRRAVNDLKPTAFSDGANNILFNIKKKWDHRPAIMSGIDPLTRKLQYIILNGHTISLEHQVTFSYTSLCKKRCSLLAWMATGFLDVDVWRNPSCSSVFVTILMILGSFWDLLTWSYHLIW